MKEIYEITGQDLINLRNALADAAVYSLRVAVDGGAKFKINQGSWTPPMGTRQGQSWPQVSADAHEAAYSGNSTTGFLVTCPHGCELGTSARQGTREGAERRIDTHRAATTPLGRDL